MVHQYASIKDRGCLKGSRMIQRWMRNKSLKYFAKLDIRKCYPSIPQDKLIQFLEKHIKNDMLIWLIKELVNSFKQGLSIGSFLSQYLCNLYLSQIYKELQEQSLNKRLDELEHKIKTVENSFMNNQEVYHNQSIEIRNHLQENQENLSNQITELSTVINDFAKTSKECTVASFRSSLWRMHRDFMAQGHVTPDGLKTFLEMGKLYEFCGGDDIYHEKLLPEVKALEVKYPEESI